MVRRVDHQDYKLDGRRNTLVMVRSKVGDTFNNGTSSQGDKVDTDTESATFIWFQKRKKKRYKGNTNWIGRVV